MDGILVVNKEKGYTSRDVVNIVSKILGTKKIGHTGTLDPIAEGVLVLCIGKYSKVSEVLTSYDKEYLSEMCLGIETDTLDIEGNVLKEENTSYITEKQIQEVFSFFPKTYLQEVPKYSAVKINGKKLYEYARNNIEVSLPKRMVMIHELKLLTIQRKENKVFISFQTKVSKGTYIRSLIRDIASSLHTVGVMTSLIRLKQGNFSIQEAYSIEDIKQGNYQLLKLKDVLSIPTQIVEEALLLKKVKNGVYLDNPNQENMILFITRDQKEIALYKKKEDNQNILVPWKMF